MLSALWSSAAAIPPVSTGAAAGYRTLFMTVRRLVVGRQVTVRLDRGDLKMTVTEFESSLDPGRLAVGQLDDVRISANDISWDASGFEHATALLHNVHVRPGTPPVVVAAPVELSLDVPAETVVELFLLATGRFVGELGDDGAARVYWSRRPAWGHVEVDAELDGSALALRPRALTLRRRRWALPVRTPAYRLRLPELPHGLQLTDVRLEPGLLRLTGTLPEWRIEISRRRLEVLLYQLSTAGLLTLTRSTLRSANPQRGT
jgi:hypothetical protein